jgi:hypothetical protein
VCTFGATGTRLVAVTQSSPCNHNPSSWVKLHHVGPYADTCGLSSTTNPSWTSSSGGKSGIGPVGPCDGTCGMSSRPPLQLYSESLRRRHMGSVGSFAGPSSSLRSKCSRYKRLTGGSNTSHVGACAITFWMLSGTSAHVHAGWTVSLPQLEP